MPRLVQQMAMDRISPAPLPSPVSVRRPCHGVGGAKRFPHSLADAINTALTTVRSADGKIPSGFITISLVSLRSPSLQAHYWTKCCFNKEQFQGWSTATDHRLGSLIYKSLASEGETAPGAKYLPYSKLSVTRWIRPGPEEGPGVFGRRPCLHLQRPSTRVCFHPSQFHLTATSLSPRRPHAARQPTLPVNRIQICGKWSRDFAVVFHRAVSESPLGPDTLAPRCTLQLNRSCQSPEPCVCVCSADRAPALGSGKEHDRPLQSGLL